MREDIRFGPAGKVQPGACRQKVKAALGELRAAFAGKAGVQFGPQLMQVENVGRGVFQLGLGQLGRPQSDDCCCFEMSMPRSS